MKGLPGFLLLALTTSCASAQPRAQERAAAVQRLQRLPEGRSCTFIERVEVIDGSGCANIGRSRAGNEQVLRYNLRQKARKRGANVMIPGPVFSETWEGCPAFGLSIQADLYRCSD